MVKILSLGLFIDNVIWHQLSSASGLPRRLGRFHDAKIQFSRPL
jgi:hypothetical protein